MQLSRLCVVCRTSISNIRHITRHIIILSYWKFRDIYIILILNYSELTDRLFNIVEYFIIINKTVVSSILYYNMNKPTFTWPTNPSGNTNYCSRLCRRKSYFIHQWESFNCLIKLTIVHLNHLSEWYRKWRVKINRQMKPALKHHSKFRCI